MPVTGATPQEVYEKAGRLGRQEQVGALLGVYPPDEHNRMLYVFMFTAHFVGPGKDAELDALLARHGARLRKGEKLDPTRASKVAKFIKRVFDESDKPALASALYQFIQANSKPGAKKDRNFLNQFSGLLTDVQVTGDRATGKSGGRRIKFRKLDGRWYISLGRQ